MGLSAETPERMKLGDSRNACPKRGDGGDAVAAAGCWKWRFLGSCVSPRSPRSKADSSVSGSSTQLEESKSSSATSREQPVAPDDASKDQPVAPVISPSSQDQPVAPDGVSVDSPIAPDDAAKHHSIAPVVLASSTADSESAPSTPKVKEENPSTPRVELELKIASQLRKFGFNELKSATRSFKQENLLGEGGFGCVYKGWISENGPAPVKPGSGITVAVKTLNHDGLQGHKEWLAEINYLGDLLHANLVKLIGYCIEDDQRLLVYEFMPRGSLENHLFRRSLPLPWATRLKIAVGAAKGLAFLHEEAERPVIYRDFKTSNILLDADYNAKLSDFGLAKDGPEGDQTHVSTRVMGTYGYAAPEYVMTGHLTSKSDVYSFGVVLLEMLSGRRSMDKTRPPGEHNLVEWARPYMRERRRLYRLIDPRLEGRFSISGAQKALQLAAQCLSRDAKSRPLMSQVVEVLKPLPDLKDMASSSPHYLAMQNERAKVGSRNGGARDPVPLLERIGTPAPGTPGPHGQQQASPHQLNHVRSAKR